jgi:hypothetical protein
LILLSSLLFWPQAAEPLYAPWGFILPTVWLLLALAEMFRRRAIHLPAPFVYAATLFPLFPLAQFSFGRLDLYSLNPGSVLIAVYIGALFYAGAIYISSHRTAPAAFEKAFQRVMLGAALISFVYSHFTIFQLDPQQGSSFRFYYENLLRFENGSPLYNLQDFARLAGQSPLPPLFSVLLWPLARLFGSNTDFALLIWRIINELLLIPCLLVLTRVFGGAREGVRLNTTVWFLALNFGQLAENLSYGQWNILVLLSFSLLALRLQTGQMARAGYTLSLAVGIRLYSLIIALLFIFGRGWRRWRGLGGLVAGCAGLVALCWPVVGFDTWELYFRQVAFNYNSTVLDISNQTLAGFWSRLSVAGVMTEYSGKLADWVAWISLASALALVALVIFVLWRQRYCEDNIARQLKLGTLIWLSVIIPPFVWTHQLGPCLVAVLSLLLALSRNASRWQLFSFALAYGALAYGSRYDFFLDEAVGLALLGSSYHFIAIMTLLGLTLWHLWRPQKPIILTEPATSQVTTLS